jgi:RNA polymerase sigma-70 factor (ECF subfamily)
MRPARLRHLSAGPSFATDGQPSADDERELLRRAGGGDHEAFRQLVDRHKEQIFRVCLGFIHDPEDAEDLTQDVFLEVYKSARRFRGASRLGTWIYRIAVNRSLNRLRDRRARPWWRRGRDRGDEVPLEQVPSAQETPEALLDRKERREILRAALGQLPKAQRVAFTLHSVEGMSHADIAAVMGCSISAVESRIHRAKRSLGGSWFDTPRATFHRKVARFLVSKRTGSRAMDCRAFEQDAVALRRDELSPERSRAMLEHRAQCETCRALHLALGEILQEAGQAQSARLSPRFWPQLETRLQEADSARSRRWSGWEVAWPPLRLAAVGAGLLLGIWAGAGLGASSAPAPAVHVPADVESDPLPHLAVLDAVPHGSFAELLIEQASRGGKQP